MLDKNTALTGQEVFGAYLRDIAIPWMTKVRNQVRHPKTSKSKQQDKIVFLHDGDLSSMDQLYSTEAPRGSVFRPDLGYRYYHTPSPPRKNQKMPNPALDPKTEYVLPNQWVQAEAANSEDPSKPPTVYFFNQDTCESQWIQPTPTESDRKEKLKYGGPTNNKTFKELFEENNIQVSYRI